MHIDTAVSWHLAGENWTAAKKASDKKDLERLPPGFSPPRSALSAVNGMLRRLMTLGELNLYNYSGGMPALAGSPEVNRSPEMNGNSGPRVNGTALGKAEKVNGVPLKVAGLGRDLVQVGLTLQALKWWGRAWSLQLCQLPAPKALWVPACGFSSLPACADQTRLLKPSNTH